MIRIIYAVFAIFMLSTGSIVFADCVTYNEEWDWRNSSYLVYDDDVSEASIPSPFSAGASYGIDVSGQDMCYEDGWRLYSKKLTCEDFGADCSTLAATDADYRPSFVLYNIYTAQFRFFVYTRDIERNDQELLIKTQVNAGGIDTESDLGLLLNDSQPISVLAEKEDDYAASNWLVFPSYKNKWIIFDKHLSYDPTESIDDNTRVTLLLVQRSTSDVYLTGDFTMETSSTLSDSVSSSSTIGVSDLYNIYESYGEPGQWASDLEDKGNELLEEGDESGSDIKEDAGETLIAMASTISSNAGWLGYAYAAYSAYSLYVNSDTSSSSSITTMYSTGSISVDGTIVEESPIEFLQYGVANSAQDESVDNARLSDVGYTSKLGLLSISERPQVVIKSVVDPYDEDFFPGSSTNRYFSLDCPDDSGETCTSWFDAFQYSLLDTDNFEDTVLVNPDSDMVITNIAIQPLFEVESFSGDINVGADNSREQGFYNPSYIVVAGSSTKSSILNCIGLGYDFARCLNVNSYLSTRGITTESTKRWDESDVIEEISPASMYNLRTGLLASPEGVNSNSYAGDSSGNLGGLLTQAYVLSGDSISINNRHSIRDVFINVYVELEHVSDSSIKVEMKLKVPVSIGLCEDGLSTNLNLSSHEQDKFFVPTVAQCNSMDHTITSPTRPDQYSTSNQNPVYASDYNANQICSEEFETQVDSYTTVCLGDEEDYSYYTGSSGGWKRKSTNKTCDAEVIDTVTCL